MANDDLSRKSLPDLQAQLEDAAEKKDEINAALEERKEEVEVETAERTRKAKGEELARRTYSAGIERLARDTADIKLQDLSQRDVRTGFALLRSDTPSAFAMYVAQSIELIEDYEGEVMSVTYFLNRSTHFVSLVYTIPTNIKDIIGEAIRQLKKLNKA